jgi:H+/gluconate symporter-like permease
MKIVANLLAFAGFATIGLLTATGDVQKVIHFAGAANEMAFCFLCFAMAGAIMFTTVLPDKKEEKNPQ